MTSDFEGFSIPDFIHYIFSYLNSSERVLNKGTTGTIFITSLVWRGPWLGIEPETSRTRSQHYATRLSRRRYCTFLIPNIYTSYQQKVKHFNLLWFIFHIHVCHNTDINISHTQHRICTLEHYTTHVPSYLPRGELPWQTGEYCSRGGHSVCRLWLQIKENTMKVYLLLQETYSWTKAISMRSTNKHQCQ